MTQVSFKTLADAANKFAAEHGADWDSDEKHGSTVITFLALNAPLTDDQIEALKGFKVEGLELGEPHLEEHGGGTGVSFYTNYDAIIFE